MKSLWPKLKTDLPGPKAAEIIQKDKQFVSPSYTRDFPCVVDSGQGVKLIDIDGNEFLDFCSGIAVCSTGHCHPEVVAVIKKQAEKLIHMSGTDFYYDVQASLAKKLATLAPGESEKKVFFTNSGAESVEAAIKLARYHTKRTHLLAFLGAFHGRTFGALSLTASKIAQKKGFAPLLPDVSHIPYPYCYRCYFGQTYGKCNFECVRYLEDTIFQKTIPPSEVAAIFFEPIQGEGGYIVPPIEFVDQLQKLSQKYGFLIVADEVQSGMGRTGKMFASEHFGLEPDIICLAKGIASGMPLGAIVAKSNVMDWQYGSHASTFGGNPISCAAALKTIELLEGGLIENSAQMGNYLIDKLTIFKEKYSFIGDIRGKGLMIGIEIVKDRESNTPAPDWRNTIIKKAFYKGLIILGCGPNSIRFAPALVVTKQDIDICLEIMESVFTEVMENRN